MNAMIGFRTDAVEYNLDAHHAKCHETVTEICFA